MYRAGSGRATAYRRARRRIHRLFAPEQGGRAGYLVDWGIMALIAVNVLALSLETVDALARQYGPYFSAFETLSVAAFTVEYLARVWSAVEDPAFEGPVSGRVRFASRPLLVVDLLAILPFYLSLAGIGADLRFLRALRLLRVLRLVKLARYSEALASFGDVLRDKKPELVVATFANGVLLVVASSVMYYAEHRAQPDAFGSIPESLWWGVVTLTTVGYGDVHPVTPLGRLFGAVTAILGIGLFALPASILASGFLEAAAGDPPECPHCGERIDRDDL